MKCSDNNLYRVNPVYSFIEPGQVLAVDVLRHLGEPKVDKMVFVTSKVAYTVQVSFTIHHEIGNKTKRFGTFFAINVVPDFLCAKLQGIEYAGSISYVAVMAQSSDLTALISLSQASHFRFP